jgi:plasmid stabilization system protein ParE
LRAIFAHIAHYTSPGHAYERLAELRTHIEPLLDNPDLGQRGDRRGERFVIVRAGDQTYRCTYRVRSQTIHVVRIRDTRRRDA